MSKSLYLVAVDGSEWAERAAQRAIKLASETGARVKLLNIIDALSVEPLIVEGHVLSGLIKDNENERVDRELFQPLLLRGQELGVEIEGESLWGDAVDLILSKVKQERANMLFVGRRGRSVFADMLLGSVANKLAHQAGVPIVLVP